MYFDIDKHTCQETGFGLALFASASFKMTQLI